MGRVFKLVLWLVLLGGAVVVGNAIFSELKPETREIVVPVDPVGEGGQ